MNSIKLVALVSVFTWLTSWGNNVNASINSFSKIDLILSDSLLASITNTSFQSENLIFKRKKRKVTICSCTELSLRGLKEVGLDEEKMKIFEKENEEELLKCEALGVQLTEKIEALSAEEQEKMREKMMSYCPALEELQVLIQGFLTEAEGNSEEEEVVKDTIADETVIETEATICSCTELSLKGFKEVGMDEEKMKNFEEKYKSELEQCEILGDQIIKEMQDLSDEQQEDFREKVMSDCPAMQELERLISAELEKSQTPTLREHIEEDNPDIKSPTLEGN